MPWRRLPQGSEGNLALSERPQMPVSDRSQIMSNVFVVAFLGLVAVAPMAYLGVMATAVKRSDDARQVVRA